MKFIDNDLSTGKLIEMGKWEVALGGHLDTPLTKFNTILAAS